MEIKLGHTPDADDAFMFYGLASGKVESDFVIKHVIKDIETLNMCALKHELDVTAVSAHAYAYVRDYVILNSGGSFGLCYGPIVITKKERAMSATQLHGSTIAIPGKLTSANLLLRLAIGEFEEKLVSFDSVADTVAKGKADAGLIIHEAQIAYDKTKFVNILDLGEWWSCNTGNLPVPLGINIASTRTMSSSQIKQFSVIFAKSIRYGLDNIDDAIDYSMQYGRGQTKETVTRFVKMYVNDLTLNMGYTGKKAIEKMLEMAQDRGITKSDIHIEVV
jgi:1,4-dihydroxy-6-naphthoate synthase